ncbi:hypothetical protein [Gracilibacillus salinarum]|uniref:DUF6438 domain-containing protein n=1 Tax=Gracilibacillus salinarum TaxID=2932255 RepID=A0ABY4GH60_9BACI|nr:hypothetical protein [Gracilibacillus salinarum]UOQ83592.1 hypothetical protein MUN87_12585 [Gracilibacillus salinarum]
MFEKLVYSRMVHPEMHAGVDVVVHQDGSAEIANSLYNKHHGKTQFEVNQQQMIQLDQLQQAFDFRDFIYPVCKTFQTDQPWCFISIIYQDGFVKEVTHNLGDSAEEGTDTHRKILSLKHFEYQIERILGLQQFTD